jgi:hypothetical protein
MAAEGRVTVSLLKSIVFTSTTPPLHLSLFGCIRRTHGIP